MINNDDEPECLICCKKIIKKTFNVKRHFEKFHADFASKLPDDINARKNIYDSKIRNRTDQKVNLFSSLKASELTTMASCQLAELILKYFISSVN